MGLIEHNDARRPLEEADLADITRCGFPDLEALALVSGEWGGPHDLAEIFELHDLALAQEGVQRRFGRGRKVPRRSQETAALLDGLDRNVGRVVGGCALDCLGPRDLGSGMAPAAHPAFGEPVGAEVRETHLRVLSVRSINDQDRRGKGGAFPDHAPWTGEDRIQSAGRDKRLPDGRFRSNRPEEDALRDNDERP